MKRIAAVLILSLIWSDAHAWWWLLRGLATRGAPRALVRSAPKTPPAVPASKSTEAFAYARPLASGARFCVRPVGASACDMHNNATAAGAVQQAVGGGYRLKPTHRPGVFEILDLAGNVVDLVEAIDRSSNQEVAKLPQYVPETRTAPVFIHNPSQHRLHLKVRGEKCAFEQIAIEPSMRADIYCPGSRTYDVEIFTSNRASTELHAVRQTISAGGHFDLSATDSSPRVWQLLPKRSDRIETHESNGVISVETMQIPSSLIPPYRPSGSPAGQDGTARAGAMEVTLRSVAPIRDGKMAFRLELRNTKPDEINVLAAIKAVGSDGISESWKRRIPILTARIITSNGDRYACHRADGIGYARGQSDWLELNGPQSRAMYLLCDRPSLGQNIAAELVVDFWVAEGDGNHASSTEYPVRFKVPVAR